MKWLIDECLHVSLLELAHRRGHIADHVNYLGRGSSKDWELMAIVMEHDYTFVTNNRLDFLALYGKTVLHAGLVVIVPNVTRRVNEYSSTRYSSTSIRAISSTPSLKLIMSISRSNAWNTPFRKAYNFLRAATDIQA